MALCACAHLCIPSPDLSHAHTDQSEAGISLSAYKARLDDFKVARHILSMSLKSMLCATVKLTRNAYISRNPDM